MPKNAAVFARRRRRLCAEKTPSLFRAELICLISAALPPAEKGGKRETQVRRRGSESAGEKKGPRGKLHSTRAEVEGRESEEAKSTKLKSIHYVSPTREEEQDFSVGIS